MKEHLYQKCLQCPWLWGCGLWWCSQWWCWLWGCSTETPADPLGSPGEIIHNNSKLFTFFIRLFRLFSLMLLTVYFCFFLWLPVFSQSTCHPLHIPLYLLFHQHTATSPSGPSRQPGMTSPVTFCPVFSFPSSLSVPLLSSFPPCLSLSSLLTHAAIAARFQLLPESLHVGQVQFVEGDGDLSYGIIPAEAVVIEDLQV